MTITECTRQNTCYDCDDKKCSGHGDKEADCPKYRCDRPNGFEYKCEKCAFIDRYIEAMRKEYKNNAL